MGLFSLKKKRWREDPLTALNYPKEATEEMEPDTSQICTKNGQEATDTSWNKGNFN